MAAGPEDDAGVAKQVRDALKRLRDAATIFSSDRPSFDEAAGKVSEAFSKITGAHGEVELSVSTNRIMVGEAEVYKSESRTANLAFDLFRQGLRRISFKPGLEPGEVESFVTRFAECRSADQIDEDFVTTMWQDSLPNISFIAIDNFTEKIFMSEAEFVTRFRSVLDDVVPGLFDMAEEDTSDGPRERVRVDSAEDVDAADLEQRKVRKAIGVQDENIRHELFCEEALAEANSHLVHLCTCILLRQNTALAASELQGIVVRVLTAYLEQKNWQGFADAIRSLQPVFRAGPGLLPSMAERIEKIERVVTGRDMAEHVAECLDPEQTNFTAWARWYFVTEGTLTAPGLLELVNGCRNPAGRDWLKDLLRRQSTASLDPWAERLRDPNPGIVIEVIDVIMSSELGDQARPLLIEALGHEEPSVRFRGIEALAGCYDLSVREALLPLLKDPDAQVRRGVVRRFVEAQDKSVASYLANIIKSGEVFAFGEDEQREVFEAVATLSGNRYLELFEEKLQLGTEGVLGKLFNKGASAVNDNPTRRAVVSGLAMMDSSKATALIRSVQSRADLSLAAHCDVVLRLTQRKPDDDAQLITEAVPEARQEDISVGRDRMGDSVLFTPERINLNGILAERGMRLSDVPAAVAPDIVGPSERAPSDPLIGGPIDSSAPDLGPRPLLSHTVVFEPWDRLRLASNPTSLKTDRYQLVDIEASFVGVSVETETSRRALQKSMPPARIIERTTANSVGPRGQQESDSQVDDLLKGYLEPSVDGDANLGSDDSMFGSSSSSADSDSTVDDLLRDYVDSSSDGEVNLDSMLKDYVDSTAVEDATPTPVNTGGGNVFVSPEVRVGAGADKASVPSESRVSDAAEDGSADVDDVLRSYLNQDSET